MKKISFVLNGNQDDVYGNPVPYTRVVRRALWVPAAKKYEGWKSFVRRTFYKHYPEFLMRVENQLLYGLKPLSTTVSYKARMDIRIYWMNGIHGDPDNIFKGIADSLFKNDKFLDGSFETYMSEEGKGRVEVDITINI